MNRPCSRLYKRFVDDTGNLQAVASLLPHILYRQMSFCIRHRKGKLGKVISCVQNTPQMSTNVIMFVNADEFIKLFK